jgi:tRNA (guanine37-N1)-methyltransferase
MTHRFDVITIFPAMVEQVLATGILGRAIERRTLAVRVHDLRDFSDDRHRIVDDAPYGGGPGMVLKPEPVFRALDAIEAEAGRPAAVVLTSPQGARFTQSDARRLSGLPHVVLVCGRYEGVDERVRERVTEELSIGDYVLSGGELAALVMVDASARLIHGVVGDDRSVVDDSFSRGLLDFPQYTRPPSLTVDPGGRLVSQDSGPAVSGRTLRVPEVLLSGNHAEIRRWRKRAAVSRTLDRRPDLLSIAVLDEEEREILQELVSERNGVRS